MSSLNNLLLKQSKGTFLEDLAHSVTRQSFVNTTDNTSSGKLVNIVLLFITIVVFIALLSVPYLVFMGSFKEASKSNQPGVHDAHFWIALIIIVVYLINVLPYLYLLVLFILVLLGTLFI